MMVGKEPQDVRDCCEWCERRLRGDRQMLSGDGEVGGKLNWKSAVSEKDGGVARAFGQKCLP